MKYSSKISLIILITMLLSLANPVSVLADEITPSTEEIETTAAQDASTFENDEVEPTPEIIESSNTQDSTIQNPETVSISENLNQLPENTELIVLDKNNEVEPLVTLEAEEIILASDPMWCPIGQTPGGAGCTASYTTVTDLIANLGSKNRAGTIYFTSTYSTNDATFDHTNLNLAGLTDLTIQGGWNGLINENYLLSGSTVFNGVSLIVTNWEGKVELKNVIVTGATDTGLSIETTGDINLNFVQSNDSISGSGALLDNCVNQGIGCTGTGNVNLIGFSNFNGNNDYGLIVTSSGNININNITANHNQNYSGVSLDNTLGDGKVKLTGINTFVNNHLLGLSIASKGNIIVSNLSAVGNGMEGIVLDNSYSGTPSSIHLTGKNNFIGNNESGGNIISNGNITISGLTSANNGENGLILSTNGSVCIELGSFNSNNDYGVEAIQVGGPLTFSYVGSNGANGLGDYIYGGIAEFSGNGCVSTTKKESSAEQKLLINNEKTFQIFKVNNIENIEFNCNQFIGTILMLSNGNKIAFNCPIVGFGSLGTLESRNLPAELPEGVEYVSGFVANQSPDGSDTALDGLVVVSFVIPEDMQGEDLAILYWNGTEWVDLETATFDDGRTVFNGGYVSPNGYFEAFTNFVGSFVLVKK